MSDSAKVTWKMSSGGGFFFVMKIGESITKTVQLRLQIFF